MSRAVHTQSVERRQFLPALHLSRGVFGPLGCCYQTFRWHDDSQLRDKRAAALDTAVNSDASATCRLGFSDCCVEEFRHAYAIHDFHDDIPIPKVREYLITPDRNSVEIFRQNRKIRFRVAPCQKLKQSIHARVHNVSVKMRCAA